MQKQYRVGAFNFRPSALNADFFNFIQRFAQASGVHHMQWHAVDLNQLRDLVTGGASNRRDDGELCTGQGIEQGAFSGVRLPGNHDLDAFAQNGTLAGPLHDVLQRFLQPLKLTAGVSLLQKINVFFREIKRCLNQHPQMDQPLQQSVDRLRELARQRTRCRAGGCFGAGVNQVGNGFGLRQVYLVVEESALGELTRLRCPQARQANAATGRVNSSCCFDAA